MCDVRAVWNMFFVLLLSPRLTGHACVERPGHAAGKFARVMCEQLGIDLLSFVFCLIV